MRELRALTCLLVSLVAVAAGGCRGVEPYDPMPPDLPVLDSSAVAELLAALGGDQADAGQTSESPNDASEQAAEDDPHAEPHVPVSASVFAIDSAQPDRSDPEWQDAIAALDVARDTAMDNGWNVVVDGCTDDTGSAAHNEVLSQDRADVFHDVLVDELKYPDERVEAVGRGICGSQPEDRRIVVRFTNGGTAS